MHTPNQVQEEYGITFQPITVADIVSPRQLASLKEDPTQYKNFQNVLADHPRTYQTENTASEDKLIYFRYTFRLSELAKGHPIKSWEWYPIEFDAYTEQAQVFGLVSGHFVEYGYFSIPELIESSGLTVELHCELLERPVRLSELHAQLKNAEHAEETEEV